MPLPGSAALLLSFDIVPEAIDEHDHWHTYEHLPERLSLPGFLRGSRWVADASPRYMVLYEVDKLAALSSPAYLARLNDPTPWTTRMMLHYRDMRRGLCSVVGSFGHGHGGHAALIRFSPRSLQAAQLDRWLLEEALPDIPRIPGLGAAHLLRGAQAAEMTNEQRIRGRDQGIDSAIVLTGYDRGAVARQAEALVAGGLDAQSDAIVTFAVYRCAYTLTRFDADAAHAANRGA